MQHGRAVHRWGALHHKQPSRANLKSVEKPRRPPRQEPPEAAHSGFSVMCTMRRYTRRTTTLPGLPARAPSARTIQRSNQPTISMALATLPAVDRSPALASVAAALPAADVGPVGPAAAAVAA